MCNSNTPSRISKMMSANIVWCLLIILLCCESSARSTSMQIKWNEKEGLKDEHETAAHRKASEGIENVGEDLEKSESAQLGYQQYFNQMPLSPFLQDIYKKTIPFATGQFVNQNPAQNYFNSHLNPQSFPVHTLTLDSLHYNSVPNFGLQSFGQPFPHSFGQSYSTSTPQSYGNPHNVHISSNQNQEPQFDIPNPQPLLTNNNVNAYGNENNIEASHRFNQQNYNTQPANYDTKKQGDNTRAQHSTTEENLGNLYTSKPLSSLTTSTTTTMLPVYDLDVRIGGRN